MPVLLKNKRSQNDDFFRHWCRGKNHHFNLSKISKKTTKLLNFHSWKIMEKEV